MSDLDISVFFFFFQAEDGIRDIGVTGVQTCALPISALPPTRVNRMPEGCLEAKQQEEERQRQEAERKDKDAHAALEENQRQETKPKGLKYARTSGTTWRIIRKKNATTDKVEGTATYGPRNSVAAFPSREGAFTD